VLASLEVVALRTTVRRSPPREVRHRRPGQLRLRITREGTPARTETFTGERIACGRSTINDFVLEDDSLSATHFSLELDPRGIRLIDRSSTNGTWFRGARVSEIWIPPGETFTAGDYHFEVLGTDTVEVPVLTATHFHGMYGESSAMREVFAQLARLADTDLDLFLEGETGTGKEMAARALHAESPRADRPFVVLDCAWLSHSLAEETIFGHARGAYTQANEDSAGCFEVAHGGTLLIDEIGELPLDIQPRLLRVLDRREVQRLGERRWRKVDVRVIAATNRDIRKMVGDGSFREDLYFRLMEETIHLPPLRNRDKDIDYVADRLLEGLSEERGSTFSLSKSAKKKMLQHRWPGNVRELHKVLRRASRLAASPLLSPEDIRINSTGPSGIATGWTSLPIGEAMYSMEREYLSRLLDDTRGNLTKASECAGMTRKGLREKLKKFGLHKG